jgi:aflatoxin B1 aldehyde reductase
VACTIQEFSFGIIDTANRYGASEELLGQAGAPMRFTIETKHPGGAGDQPATRDEVLRLGKESLSYVDCEPIL